MKLYVLRLIFSTGLLDVDTERLHLGIMTGLQCGKYTSSIQFLYCTHNGGSIGSVFEKYKCSRSLHSRKLNHGTGKKYLF